jgi:transmembrane sensor
VGLCVVTDKHNNPPVERRAWRTDDEWARLRERITAGDLAAPAGARPFKTSWMVAAAAIAIVAAGASWRALQRPASRTSKLLQLSERVASTGPGERRTIRLGDSSVVALGPMSTIRYSESDTARNVVVTGIADFSVVHDATRPFHTHAKNAVITDVGTEFVVRAYAADSGVDVAVSSGIVEVSGGAPDSVELRAGQVAFVNVNGRTAKVASVSPLALAEFVQGHLVFDNEPLATVAGELGRWFGVEIRIPDRQLAQRRVSATYNQPTLSGALDALTATLSAHYQRVGGVVTIVPAAR